MCETSSVEGEGETETGIPRSRRGLCCSGLELSLLGVVASSSWRWSSMASFGLFRDSSMVFPWLAMSRSGHHLN